MTSIYYLAALGAAFCWASASMLARHPVKEIGEKNFAHLKKKQLQGFGDFLTGLVQGTGLFARSKFSLSLTGFQQIEWSLAKFPACGSF